MSLIHRSLRYWLQATPNFRQHPGSVSDLVEALIGDQQSNYYIWQDIETQRQLLLEDKRILDLIDYGAGSRINNSKQRRVADIAKHAVSPRWQCERLFRLTKHLQPPTVLEMGTSLGISSAYLAASTPAAQCISLEGDPATADIARSVHQVLDLKNVQVIKGPFSESLSRSLNQLSRVDLAFIDGHHIYQPTIHYTEEILPYCHEHSVLIYDDIYWSGEMYRAWQEIQHLPQVRCTIDTYYQGIVLFDESIPENTHVAYCPKWLKPWR